MNDPGLGLTQDKSALPTEMERPYVEYTIPEDKTARFFASMGFTAADRTFRMVEITPIQQDHAAKISGQNPSVLSRELLFASLWQVGDWRCRNNRERLTKWWEAIGAKGRRLVEAAFMDLQSVAEGDVETFLASGRPQVG